MTAAGGDPGRTSGHCSSQNVNKSFNKGVNFRGALRGMFRAALERLAADGGF